MADVRIYADEDISAEIVRGLREYYDVSYVNETAYRSRSDAWHFNQAGEDGRVLVTCNHKDFQRLHQIWVSVLHFGIQLRRHPGILTTSQTPRNSSDWLTALHRQLVLNEDLSGRILLWIAHNDSWREDDWRPDL